MSTTSADRSAAESPHELDIYPKRGIQIVRGKDAKVWDHEGREYLDAAGAYGVANIGHANEEVARAVAEQARKLVSCPGAFSSDVRSKLLQKLVGIAPKSLTRAFLCNSGTEALEAAIKFARYTTGRKELVCAMRGFHGRTLGALSATYEPKYKQDFAPLVPGFIHVPFNDCSRLEAAVSERTAGVILEIVQGEGGIYVGTGEYFDKARRVCRERGAMLIVDEVQTGFCRTGRMFASMHFDLEPDMMCVAKGIAGGLPMGATIVSDAVAAPTGLHGSTFGGNPLCCAAASAAIDFMKRHRLDERARERGDLLVSLIEPKNLSRVREVRHLGLMIGVELREKVTPILKGLQQRGVLALPAGKTVLRLLPPLVISEGEIRYLADQIVGELR